MSKLTLVCDVDKDDFVQVEDFGNEQFVQIWSCAGGYNAQIQLNSNKAKELRDWLNEKYPVEVIAQVEAERDAVCSAMRRQSERHDELLSTLELATNQRDVGQAQLAEAVGLLKGLRPTIPRDVLSLWCIDRDAFLARHAQAERQEGE